MAVATTASPTGRSTISIFRITCWGISGSCFLGGLVDLFVFHLQGFEKCVYLSLKYRLYVFLLCSHKECFLEFLLFSSIVSYPTSKLNSNCE